MKNPTQSRLDRFFGNKKVFSTPLKVILIAHLLSMVLFSEVSMTWLKFIGKTIFFGGVLVLTLLVSYYFYVRDELPTPEQIRDVRFQIPMKIYTADGELMSQFGEKRRTPLLYQEFPQELIDAIIATEDARFYEHFGFDPIGIFSAAYGAFVKGDRARGASTITQQLARNVFLTFERTAERKIKELFIALQLEQTLSKKEILTLYLNKIFLGNRAYGMGAAAQVYYDKPLKDLTLPQLAMLAGLPKAPSSYNPIRRKEKAKWRRNVVLSRMLAVGAIDQVTFEEAKNAPITAKLHGANVTAHAPYVAEEIRKQMVAEYGREAAYTSGFKVYTSIDSKAQLAAQKAVKNNIHRYDERHGYRGPERYLWNEEQIDSTQDAANSWDMERIAEFLKKQKPFGELLPAVVTNVTEQEAYVQLSDNQFDVISWQNLNWAREFISDNKQGPAPKQASDVVKPGAKIWVRPLKDGSLRLSQIPEVSGSLVAIDPENGDIKALVGGYNFENNQFNRVTQAKRQVGSNIKPFIYSAALDHNATLATLVNDAPINKWDKGEAWRPKNSPEVYDGPTRVRKGLAMSKNVMSVRLMRSIGLDKTIDHLTRFGFSPEDLPHGESLSLGSATMTPLKVATGMAAFANGGYLVESNLIDKVMDPAGQIVFQPTKYSVLRDSDLGEMAEASESFENYLPAPRVISEENAFLVAEAMTSTIWGGGNWSRGTGWNGTGWRATTLKRKDVSGKTGTTNDSVDTWFTGFTPKILATTWVGFDAPGRSLGRTSANPNIEGTQLVGSEAGALAALPAWVDFMSEVLPDVPYSHRDIPEGIISVRIDLETGLLTRKSGYTTGFEYFIRGTQPTRYAENTNPISIEQDEKDLIEEDDEIF